MREIIDFHLSRGEVTDVLVSAQSGIWVDAGSGLEPISSDPFNEADVRKLAVDLIALGHRHLDPVLPYADVRLPGGLRVHAVLAPVSVTGTTISIRISRSAQLRCEALLASGFMTAQQHSLLSQELTSGRNVLITGGAGVGKTTLLAALLSEAPSSQRIVTIEDVAELELDHPQHVRLESRQPNIEGHGAITTADLIPQALRMRADRIAVGECRGAEWAPLLSAMNVGHGGGGTTVHASSLEDVAGRVLALGFLSGMSRELTAVMVPAAFGLVAHLERNERGRYISTLGRFIPQNDTVEVRAITSQS